ncbi:MAG: hypothetical protein HXY22_11815 [Alphaproteobacteria bacterium]|nr:hypothetical protein [Alphaproteobacteria bacterium]
MGLKRVRIELARSPGFPEGSRRHGYEFVAPLDDEGHLDAAAHRLHKSDCKVRRFWGDEEEEHGTLIHGRAGWWFDYDSKDEADDEPLFKLDRHTISEGEYISVTEHDGKLYAFRVVSVRPF